MSETNRKRILPMLLLVAGLPLAGCDGGGSDPAATPAPVVQYTYRVPADRGDGWSTASAADQGIIVADIERMMNDIRAGNFDYIDSVAVARGGVLVLDETVRTTTDFEDSRVGNTDLGMHRQFSVSKSVTSLIVGRAIDDGYLADTGVTFPGLFPYPDYLNPDPRKDSMTLGDVLAMQAGLEWDEWDPPYTSADNQLVRFLDEHIDYSKALLDLPMASEPGTQFAYNTAATIALLQAVENALPLPVFDYARDRVLLPLGISRIEVLATPTGLPNGGSGFYFRTRDVLKFGQLLLDEGAWNDERIVSAAWLAESLLPRATLGWSNPQDWDWQIDGYGYQWWTGHYEMDGRNVDTRVAWGFGGQWVIAIPEFDLVIAVNSHGYDGEDRALNQGHRLVRRYLLPAIAD